MVDLVEDDQRPPGHGAPPVHLGRHADLGVGDHGTVEVGGGVQVRVAERGVELDAHPGRGLRPLGLQMLRRGHHGDRLDGAVVQQLGGDPEGEGGLAGAGRGDRREVLGTATQVLHHRLALPGPQGRKRLERRQPRCHA
jgi:hypothetical protein